MQLLSKLTALAAFMTTASALAVDLDERATTPSVSLLSYAVIECTKTSAGGVDQAKQTTVTENNCTALPLTSSFEAIIINPCPANKSPELTVYSLAGCSGTGVVERGLTKTNIACIEAQLGGAKSAFFKCNAA